MFHKLIIFVISLLFIYLEQSSAVAKEITLCTKADKINFYPFREFTDYIDLQYLLLLSSSYISTDPQEIGILTKWDFSPDGHTLYAFVNENAKWQDGQKISPREAAFGIAKGLT